MPLAAIWGGANLIHNGNVENDIRSKAVAASGLGLEETHVAGRDVTLAGTVFAANAGETARAAVAREWGVRRVNDTTALPAVATPYEATLTSAGGKTVVLSGHVPDPAAREAAIATARATWPSATIEDKLTYAGGAPQGFGDLVGAGIEAAGKLVDGGFTLKDGTLSLTGTAPDRATYRAVSAAAAPSGTAIDTSAIVAPAPYVFSAGRSGDVVTLEGQVPSEDAHGSLVQRARDLFFDAKIDDKLTVDADAPEGVSGAMEAGLQALSRLGSGLFSIKGGDVALQGSALYEKASASIRDTLTKALPAGFKVTSDTLDLTPALAPMNAQACQFALDTILSRGAINFDTDSAVISGVSAGVLDRLVSTIAACPQNQIRISGHTDATGDASINQPLSEDRAKSVATYLADAGLNGARFVTEGFGASRPIASNETEEGKARNRRIEFVVVQGE